MKAIKNLLGIGNNKSVQDAVKAAGKNFANAGTHLENAGEAVGELGSNHARIQELAKKMEARKNGKAVKDR